MKPVARSLAVVLFAVQAGTALHAFQGANLTELTSMGAWEAAIGNAAFQTVGFTEFPEGTTIAGEYAAQGVQFTDGNDVVSCYSFLSDGCGLDGTGRIEITFDEPQLAVAADYAVPVQFEIYAGAVLLAISNPLGTPSTLGFGGIVSDTQFDRVVIRDGANDLQAFVDDLHFYRNDAPLVANGDQISVSAGGTVGFSLDADVANAGNPYLLLGSVSGTSPGTPVGGMLIPLNVDAYTLYTLQSPNAPPLAGSFALLDAQGRATASFTVPPASTPNLVGLTFDHAYVVVAPTPVPLITLASNAVAIQMLP